MATYSPFTRLLEWFWGLELEVCGNGPCLAQLQLSGSLVPRAIWRGIFQPAAIFQVDVEVLSEFKEATGSSQA